MRPGRLLPASRARFMVWFKKEKAPKQPQTERRLKMPEGLWVKCEACKEMIYKKEVLRNANVCPKCNYHFRISAQERLELLCDDGAWEESEFTGTGFPRVFYLRYHYYPIYFPLMALSRWAVSASACSAVSWVASPITIEPVTRPKTSWFGKGLPCGNLSALKWPSAVFMTSLVSRWLSPSLMVARRAWRMRAPVSKSSK